MIEVMLALTCQLVGVDPSQPNGACLGVDPATGKIGFLPAGNVENGQIGGAIGGMSNMISMLYTPPIHTSDYFQNLAQNFGIVKNANAQVTGSGFKGLEPLQKLWEAFRNIVYLIFVIVFVVIGLAIMLRIKIDPRTVMTIQNQIPKIIIGILLVTFSFAIGGFLIDLMWVTIYLVFGIISGVSPEIASNVSKLNPALHLGDSPFGVLGGNINGIASSVSFSIRDLLLDLLGLSHLKGGFSIDRAFEAIKSFGTSEITRAILFGIPYLIILIALLIALFRLWFTLLMAYIHILIDVVLAPFWIVGSLVPGSPISATGWLRDLIANLAAFPAVIALFLLGKVFQEGFTPTSNAFVPPLIGNPGSAAIGPIIGLGIILMSPSVVAMIKAAIKAPKLEGGGAGKLIGAGAGVVGGTAKSSVGAGATALMGDPFNPTGPKGLSAVFRSWQRKNA